MEAPAPATARLDVGEPTTDERMELVRAQRGDRRAQSALVRRHHARVTGQIRGMCHDPASLEDLVQEVFLSAWKALPQFRGESTFTTWLYTIASNRVRGYWDSQRRRRRRESAAGAFVWNDAAGPEERLAARQQEARAFMALARLPDRLREAFHARIVEGMSLQEASAALGVPISTLSYRTRRAWTLLAARLGLDVDAADRS